MSNSNSTEKRYISVEDVNQIQYVNDPQLSPDGQWVAYVVRSANPMEKKYNTHIHLAPTDGSRDPIQLTRGGSDSHPRWSPDGTQLAFVSARADKPQIYLLPVTAPGGEARPLTSMERGAVAPAWSPDGAHIAFLSSVNADERAAENNDDDDDTDKSDDAPKDQLAAKHRKERQQHDEEERYDPRPMERIPYRQGTGYMDDRHAQVYVMATDDNLESDDAKPRRLTDVDAGYAPPQWSPDGSTLYTTRAYDTEADEYFRYGNIYSIDVASGDETRYADTAYTYFAPKPSPDGKWLVATRSPFERIGTLTRLCVIPVSEDGTLGDATDVNIELDRAMLDYTWRHDNTLVVIVEYDGRMDIRHLDPTTQTYTLLTNEDIGYYGVSVDDDDNLAYVSRTTTRLDELFYLAADGAAPQQLSSHNAWLDDVTVLPTHELKFTNPHGDEIQGWYVLPPDYDESQQYPLALNIHGGPYAMWSPATRSMWHEWQSHAAAGYVVFYCNPRGSDGYGEDFLQALYADWGEVAMDDVMAGVDAVIEATSIDTARMAITGGSYGGYLTGWIIGHTDRFAAAVPQRGVYNLSSFYGTSDVPILISAEFGTEPWDDHNKLWQNSPLAHAHNITTPTLIIHAELDFRVPIEQAEQFFAWIRRATDTPVKMLRYPREGHELSRSGEPAHRISRLTEMISWFDAYCKADTDDADTKNT